MFIQNSITVCLSADFQPFGKENHLSSFSLKMFSLSLTEADLKHQQSLWNQVVNLKKKKQWLRCTGAVNKEKKNEHNTKE